MQFSDEIREGLDKDIRFMASHGLRLLGLSFKEGEALGFLNDFKSKTDVTNPAYKDLMKSSNVAEIEED